jgi:hypothetical protein
MAVRIPSQSEIEQFLYNIDELEGYSYAEYLDYMEEVYPEVDAAELYKSKGENIVTGYRDIQGNFVAGEKPEIDPDVMAMIEGMPTGIDRMNQEIAASAEEIDALPLTQAEKSAAFMERLRERKLAEDLQEEESVVRAVGDGMGASLDSLVARGQQIAEDYAYRPIPATGRIVDSRMAKSDLGEQGMLLNLTDEEQAIYNADLPLRPELIPGDTIIEDMVASAAESMDLPPWAMAVAGAVATKGKSLTKKKSTIKEKKQDDLFKQDGMVTKTNPVKSKAASKSVKAKAASSTVSKDKLNPNTVEGMIAAQAARNAARAGNAKKVETVIAKGNKPEGRGFRRIDGDDVAKVKAAAGAAAVTAPAAYVADRMLSGDRDVDGNLKTSSTQLDSTKGTGGVEDVPAAQVTTESFYKDMPPAEKAKDNRTSDEGATVNLRPGWKQAENGNYFSADFEDEHWNTPSGVKEAIGIWGRPIGNKYVGQFKHTPDGNPFTNQRFNPLTGKYN